MKQRIFILAMIIFALLVIAFMANEGLTGLTSASVVGQKKCVGANAALKFINEKGCERIYDDPECAEKGLVEIQC